ncbi:MAG: HAD hydrolase-like protein, partial [Candidatus Omnitrophota bacterium]
MYKWKSSIILKFIALLITGLILQQDVVWAVGDVSEFLGKSSANSFLPANSAIKNINISKDLAQVDEKMDLSDAAETIITIQDCHSSLSAQYSIVNILQQLFTDYDIDLIAVEGGSDRINTALLGTCPDKEAKEKTAAFLMKTSRISAGEFFSILNQDKVALYGVEDNDLYQKNIKYFQKIYAVNREKKEFASFLINELKKAEDNVYSNELSRFVFKSRLHKKGKLSFQIYWDFLTEIADKNNIDLKECPNIEKLTSSIELEKRVDFGNAALQRKELVELLLGKSTEDELKLLAKKAIFFKQGRITESSYYRQLFVLAETKGINTEKYKDLIGYIDYISFSNSLNILAIQKETELLEKQIIEKLFLSEKERELYELVRFTEKLGALFELKLDSDGYKYILEKRESINSGDYCAFLKNNRNISEDNIFVFLSGLEDNLEFYRIADERNKAMIANTVKAMRSQGKQAAALISGGHHTKGLTSLMKQNGLSYLILMPRFAKDKNRPYVTVLTKKREPYEKLSRNGAYDLALPVLSGSTEISKFDEAIVYMSAQIVRSGLSLDDKKQKWINSYKTACNTFSSGDNFILIEEFEKRLKTVQVDVQEEFCIVTIADKRYRVNDESVKMLDDARKSKKTVTTLMWIEKYLKELSFLSEAMGSHIGTFYGVGPNRMLVVSSIFAQEILKEVTERLGFLKVKEEYTQNIRNLKIAFFDWDDTIIRQKLDIFKSFEKEYIAIGGKKEEFDSFRRKIKGMPFSEIFDLCDEIAKKSGKVLPFKNAKELKKAVRRKRRKIFKQAKRSVPLLIEGIEDFLTDLQGKGVLLYVISLAPRDEVIQEIKDLGLDNYFSGVFGSPSNLLEKLILPRTKSGYIRKILKKKKISSNNAVMFGDTIFDAVNAEKARVDFIGRTEDQEIGQDLLENGAKLRIRDYRDKEGLLANLAELKRKENYKLAETLKIAFFDWDGTVTDTHMVALKAFKRVYLEIGGKEEEFLPFWNEIDGKSGAEQVEIYRSIARKNNKPFPYKDGVDFVETIIQIRQEIMESDFQGEIPLVKDIEEVFKDLYRQGIEIHIASGLSTKELRRQMEELGLGKYFSGVFGSASNFREKYTLPKTKAGYITKTLKKKKISYNNAVMFGDTTSDAKNAKKAGVDFIGRAFDAKREKELFSESAKIVVKDYMNRERLLQNIENNLSESIELDKSIAEIFSSSFIGKLKKFLLAIKKSIFLAGLILLIRPLIGLLTPPPAGIFLEKSGISRVYSAPTQSSVIVRSPSTGAQDDEAISKTGLKIFKKINRSLKHSLSMLVPLMFVFSSSLARAGVIKDAIMPLNSPGWIGLGMMALSIMGLIAILLVINNEICRGRFQTCPNKEKFQKRGLFFGEKGRIKKLKFLFVPLILIIMLAVFMNKGKKPEHYEDVKRTVLQDRIFKKLVLNKQKDQGDKSLTSTKDRKKGPLKKGKKRAEKKIKKLSRENFKYLWGEERLFDDCGRPFEGITAEGVIEHYNYFKDSNVPHPAYVYRFYQPQYDSQGNLINSIMMRGEKYDKRGNLIDLQESGIFSDGSKWKQSIDLLDNRTHYNEYWKDSHNLRKYIRFDKFGGVEKVSNYDEEGNLVNEYDGYGRVHCETLEDGSGIRNHYPNEDFTLYPEDIVFSDPNGEITKILKKNPKTGEIREEKERIFNEDGEYTGAIIRDGETGEITKRIDQFEGGRTEIFYMEDGSFIEVDYAKGTFYINEIREIDSNGTCVYGENYQSEG